VISVKRKLFCLFYFISSLDKSFNEDDEYKQKFNPNLIRNKLIQMFKRKGTSLPTSTNNSNRKTTNATSLDRQHDKFIFDRQSDIEEEDPPSDISDSTIPVDQWSIESVPKPGFTPVQHLQTLRFVNQR
jgi:hypothetical protein